MATDPFGNILSPEEEERQRRHAEAMGLLPPALRVQMTAPFGGGVGPQLNQYQGMTGSPRVPHHSQPGDYFEQNITPIPTDVTVDPTMAGMAGVTQDYGPFSRSLGALANILGPAPSSSLPSYFDDPGVSEEMERLVADDAATRVDDFAMLASQDPVASLGGWVKDVTKPVELPGIVEKKEEYYSPMPNLSPEDMVPQTGFVPAPTNVGYSQVMTDAGIDPTLGGMAPVQSGYQNTTNASYGDLALSGELGSGAVPYDRWGAVAPEEGEIYDVNRHLGLTMGVWPKDDYGISTPKHFLGNLGTLFTEKNRKSARDALDNIPQFLDDRTDTDKLQDIINNQIAEDIDTSFTNQGLTQLEKYNQGRANPNIVYDKNSLDSMVALAKDDYYKSEEQVQEAINEVKSGVGTFKELSTQPAFTPVSSIATKKSGPTHVPTQPAVPAYTGPTRAELKAAAVAQRKADLAAQKAAARRTALARQALKDSQASAAKAQAASAAQAKSEQAKARAVLARMNNDRNTPSQREINAAIEVMSQVDTFGGGGLGLDGGGFDPQGGTTGSSGMGDWT